MFLSDLRNALLETIRTRVRNGELTERGLAKMLGISQPHMHNVLKGARSLSIEMSDRVLAQLRISVLDLVDRRMIDRYVVSEPAETGGATSLLPLLAGKLGPSHPWPQGVEGYYRFAVPASVVARMSHPVVARLGSDVRMEPLFSDGDLLLLDQSPAARAEVDPNGLYVLKRGDVGVVRRLRRSGRTLYSVTENTVDRPAGWERLAADEQPVTFFVRARAIFVTQDLEWELGIPRP